MKQADRIQRAREMRYKKSIVKSMNLDDIRNTLYEIEEESSNVQWLDDELGALEDILGEDEAQEFRMLYADLSNNANRLQEEMDELEGLYENFDDVAVVLSNDDDTLMGFDSYVEDYYGLEPGWESNQAIAEAGKRLERLTKKELIQTFQDCQRLMWAFANIRLKYERLQASFEILRGEQTAVLDAVRNINELYEQIEAVTNGFERRLEFADETLNKKWQALLAELPNDAWIQ